MKTYPPCIDCVAEGRAEPNQGRRRDRCTSHYKTAMDTGAIPRQRAAPGESEKCAHCDETAVAKGLCATHYARAYRGADLTAPLRGTVPKPKCSFDGCGKPLHADGLCAGHDSQRKRGKPLAPLASYKPRTGQCEATWEGERCPRDVANDGLCRGHYDRKIKMQGAEGWDAPIRPKGKHGEGYITDDGYKIIYVNGRKVREHVYVMEQEIGRKLRPKEQVHHLRGGIPGRSNNALDNLELWTKQHPTGHRVVDVIAYTFEQQDLYLDLMDDDMLDTLTSLGERARARREALATATVIC